MADGFARVHGEGQEERREVVVVVVVANVPLRPASTRGVSIQPTFYRNLTR